MRDSHQGIIAEVKGLSDAGYGQVGASGTTPGGLRATLSKPKFERDKEKNKRRQAQNRTLKVYVDAVPQAEEQEKLVVRAILDLNANPNERPDFIDSWLADLREDKKRYGLRKLVPTVAICSVAIGTCVAYYLPVNKFWNDWQVSTTFLAAILTINGLLLALSWASFAKIYEIASEPKFALFLRKGDLLTGYFFM
jgi:hypothetical protein